MIGGECRERSRGTPQRTSVDELRPKEPSQWKPQHTSATSIDEPREAPIRQPHGATHAQALSLRLASQRKRLGLGCLWTLQARRATAHIHGQCGIAAQASSQAHTPGFHIHARPCFSSEWCTSVVRTLLLWWCFGLMV